MKSPHLILLANVLITTVVAGGKRKEQIPATLFKLLNNPAAIDYSDFPWTVPKSNSSNGWPYSNEFIRPFSPHPTHVIPNGCAWYSQLSEFLDKDGKRHCEASECPAGTTVRFRGMTPQRTLQQKGKRPCPRQRKRRVEATFCCADNIFREGSYVGAYSMDVNKWDEHSDCQWIGSEGVCWGEEHSCPLKKYRNEVARAADVWVPGRTIQEDDDEEGPKNTTEKVGWAFGSPCEAGDRILCCKDKIFKIQEFIDVLLTTELNYFFPMLLQKKNKYEGMKIKLIFAPGATRPTASTAATKKSGESFAPPKESFDAVDNNIINLLLP